MLAFCCQRMLPVFICLQLALPLCAAIAQEEGRPSVHIKSDEQRKADEKRTEERFREERPSTERSVTEIERAAREIDPTKRYNTENLDAASLLDKIRADERQKTETKDALRPDEAKITEKIAQQMVERGWTESEIRGLLTTERSGISVDGRDGRNDPASVYGKSREYIVVNDRTKEIIQLSNKNDPTWRDDSRINWR
jgi:hypothetical protein